MYAFNYAMVKTKSAASILLPIQYWLSKVRSGREPSFLVASEANALKLESKPNKKKI